MARRSARVDIGKRRKNGGDIVEIGAAALLVKTLAEMRQGVSVLYRRVLHKMFGIQVQHLKKNGPNQI